MGGKFGKFLKLDLPEQKPLFDRSKKIAERVLKSPLTQAALSAVAPELATGLKGIMAIDSFIHGKSSLGDHIETLGDFAAEFGVDPTLIDSAKTAAQGFSGLKANFKSLEKQLAGNMPALIKLTQSRIPNNVAGFFK